jgi:integrase
VSRVHVFDLRQRAGSKNPWYVRWRVDGRDASRQFRTKGLAREFHARILMAANTGERFDPATKLPVSMVSEAGPSRPRTCYQAAVAFMAHKWSRWAATTRRSAVETLMTSTETLLRPGSPPPPANVHRWLRDLALLAPFGEFDSLADQCRDEEDHKAHRWLLQQSLPLTDLDLRTAERVLDAFAHRRDGAGPTAPSVISRKRTQFRGYLKYCVRERWLPEDPLTYSDWKTPLIDREVSTELLMAPADAQTLLAALPQAGRLGPRLVAFFATLFYAGLRPSEALALTPADLSLPDTGWGHLTVRRARTKTSSRYTDDGQPHQQRPLKWRSRTAIRQVPIPPVLVQHLREHLQVYGTSPEGALFTNSRGNQLDHARYLRVFTSAKQQAFASSSPLQRVTPYGLRHANATMLLNAGVPLAEAARRLGHSPDVLLSIYAGVMTTDEKTSNAHIENHLTRVSLLPPETRSTLSNTRSCPTPRAAAGPSRRAEDREQTRHKTT